MKIRAAITGASTLTGKALKDYLPKSSMDIEDVMLLDDEDLEGIATEYDEGSEMLSNLSSEVLKKANIVFLCSEGKQSRDYVANIRKSAELSTRIICIDMCSSFSDDDSIPKISSRLPRTLIHDSPVALSDPLSIAIASLIDACSLAAVPVSIAVQAFLPVSELGHTGIEALHNQTIELLNFASPNDDVFGRQMIFNLVPGSGKTDKDGFTAYEQLLRNEVKNLTGLTNLPFLLTVAQAPTFFSTLFSAHITFADDFSAMNLPEILDGLDEFETDIDLEKGYPGPLEATDSEKYIISRISVDPAQPNSIMLNVCFDNIVRGRVLEGIALAHKMLKETEIVT